MSATTEHDDRSLFEIIIPRTNTASLTAAEHFLAALAPRRPLSLEIWGTPLSCHFLLRPPSDATLHDLHARLGAAYPQAEVRRLAPDHPLGDEPLCVQPTE